MNNPASTSSSRGSVSEWVQTALIALNLAWTTLGLGGYRAETMVITCALTGALAVAHFGARCLSPTAVPTHPAGWLLVPFLVYAAANVTWVSPVPWLGWTDWFGWAEMVLVFWVGLNGIRSRRPRAALFFTLIALAVISVALGCYQRFVSPNWLPFGRVRPIQFHDRASGPFGIPNSLAALLLLVLPAVGALLTRRHGRATERVWWSWVGVLLVLGLVLTISRGAWLALAVALTLSPLFAGRGDWLRRLAVAAGILAAVGGATAIIFQAAPEIRHRFGTLERDGGEHSRPIIWRAAWQLFRSAPLLGTGAGSYNVRFENHRPEGFLDEPQWAHNDYLNTLSDYGAVGFALCFGGGLAVAFGCVRRRPARERHEHDGFDRRMSAGLALGLLAFALQLFVDFHFKLAALAMAFAVAAALVVGRAWPVRPCPPAVPRWRRAAAAFAGLGVAAAVALVFVPAFRADALRERARRSIDELAAVSPAAASFRERLASARQDLGRANRINSANGQAWADLAYAISLWALVETGRDTELGRDAEAAADRALALSSICPEFWIRRGVARDMQGRWLEAGSDFAQAVVLAPNNSLPWFYHADHLSRRPAERALADAALAFCLRLDPGNRPALALRQRLAISSKVP